MKINLNKPARVSKSSLLTEESRKTSHERNGSINEDIKYRIYSTLFGVVLIGAILGIIWAGVAMFSTATTLLSSKIEATAIKEPVDPSPVIPSDTEEVIDSFMDVGDKVEIKQIQYIHYQYGYRDYYLIGLTKKKVLDWYEIYPEEVIYDADKVSYIERKKDNIGTLSNSITYVIHLTDQFPMIISHVANND
ncbi:hypothetical protein PTI45_03977 [Paenibacillus nuruki]|uniref:Uncharacterized protein n=1 Tax=Paenibacillus nuruki TaxID=1886670 RepID=A0A1E3KYP8_9BACL|nr:MULTISPECIES: hypothetical protein [Paenibacillus]ODP26659.1 hypothetical protein PTI45_03977 [Paenibacillus nuruki]TKJ83757.1 hypothetical protein PaeCFBP13512_22335 [Paenibacillus sp. CFBP13512]